MTRGVSQHITGPTRHFPGQISTGLDHYFTNQPDKLSQVQKHSCGGSDHMMISGIRRSRSLRSSSRYIRKRSYKEFDPQIFLTKVQAISWVDLYLCDDVEKAVEIFTKNITNILDIMAPMKTFQVRANYAPFLSKETRDLMKARDELHKLASDTRTKDDWDR